MEEFDGPYLRVEGYSKPLLNMANFDFLGMGQRKELKAAATQALDKVGEGRRHVRGGWGRGGWEVAIAGLRGKWGVVTVWQSK